MAKRINILTRYRLERVIGELKEIRKDTKLNKIDDWNLTNIVESLEQILVIPSTKKKTKDDVLSSVS